MCAQIKLTTKNAAQFCTAHSKNYYYSELSLFVDLLLTDTLSLGVLSLGASSLGALSFSSFSAFFVLEESPEGDLWSVA